MSDVVALDDFGLNQPGDRVAELVEALRKSAQSGGCGAEKLEGIGEPRRTHRAGHCRVEGERSVDSVERHAQVGEVLDASGGAGMLRDQVLHGLLQLTDDRIADQRASAGARLAL